MTLGPVFPTGLKVQSDCPILLVDMTGIGTGMVERDQLMKGFRIGQWTVLPERGLTMNLSYTCAWVLFT